MRIFPQLTQDAEFAELGNRGFSGSLNDRQFSFLRANGYTNSLTDMMAQFKTFSALTALSSGAAILAAWRPSRLDTLFQDRAGSIPVTAPGQPVGFVRDATGGVNHLTAINDASRGTYDVDANGKAFIAFDGVDDGYSTPVMSPGVDKAQVFAGVRKLSDAAVGVPVEYSPLIGSNPGSFAFSGPANPANADYFWGSRGTATATVFSPSSFAAPISNVLTGIGDISGDVARLRINGVQRGQSLVDQGTGNYGNHQMFVGRRGGTTSPFNGRIYDMIVRFSATNLDPALIEAVEREVAFNTGVTW